MYPLERVRPESVGISPAAILHYLKGLEQTGFIAHSIMIIRHGKVAFEIHYKPFRPDILHMMCSCSKSVASTAVGFAIAEGLLSLDDKIVDLLPEKLTGAPHEYVSAMTVRHLLTMTTAFSEYESVTGDLSYDFLNNRPDHYPGTIFGYDSLGTYTLCEIVQKLTGARIDEYLRPRLFEPLGIETVDFPVSKQGVCMGNGAFCMYPEDMAKFGMLYLNDGIWNGRRVLPEGWAREATAGHVSCATTDGSFRARYGYKFWRVQNNGFAALGLAGQTIVMHPDKDLVFVGTANGFQTDNHYFHMELMWRMLYPTLADGPIPYNDAAYAELRTYADKAEVFLPCADKGKRFFAALRMTDSADGVGGDGNSSCVPGIPARSGRFYPVRPNALGCDGFALLLNDKGGAIELSMKSKKYTVPFGYGKHIPGTVDLHEDFTISKGDSYVNACAAAGGWADEKTLVVQSHVLDTLEYFIITIYFGDAAQVLEIMPFGIYKYEGIPCRLTCLQ